MPCALLEVACISPTGFTRPPKLCAAALPLPIYLPDLHAPAVYCTDWKLGIEECFVLSVVVSLLTTSVHTVLHFGVLPRIMGLLMKLILGASLEFRVGSTDYCKMDFDVAPRYRQYHKRYHPDVHPPR